MKKIIYFIFIFSITSNFYCQNLTLDELIDLRKNEIADIEEFVTRKNWTFLSASKPIDNKLGKVVFTFNKSVNDDKAECFLTYLYVDKTTRLKLQFINKEKYNEYLKRLKPLGFKLAISKVKDDAIVKIYQEIGTTIEIIISSKIENNITKTSYNLIIATTDDYLANLLEE